MMREALFLIDAWGFTYKSIAFQWVKQNRSGNGSNAVSQLIMSPIREHSRKPDEVRDRIVELLGDLPRIELFAREAAPGWDCWGKEAPINGVFRYDD